MSMSNESTGPLENIADKEDTATIKRQIFMGIIYRTAALALFAAFVIIYFPESVFFYPAIYAAAILYVGLVTSLLIAGKMSRPLTYASIVLAVTVFITMSLPVQDLFPAGTGLEIPVLLTGIIMSIHCLSRAYSEFTGVITRALLIASAGILYYSAFTAVDMPVLSQLSLLALIAFVSAAIFSLLGILKRHSNEQVAYVGNLFSRIESPVVVSVIVAAIMTYVLLIRQSLESMGSFGLAVIEWAALSGIVLFIFVKIQSTVLADTTEKLRAVDGMSVLYSDKAELDEATGEVRAFVDGGQKEGLVMRMATVLNNNDIPANKSGRILSIIIDHKDMSEPPAMFKWAVGNINETNRKNRQKAVDDVMAAMVSAIDSTKSEDNHRSAADLKKRRV